MKHLLTSFFIILISQFAFSCESQTTVSGPTSVCNGPPYTSTHTVSGVVPSECDSIFYSLSVSSGSVVQVLDANGQVANGTYTQLNGNIGFTGWALADPIQVTVLWDQTGCQWFSAITGNLNCDCAHPADLYYVQIGDIAPVSGINVRGTGVLTTCSQRTFCADSSNGECGSFKWNFSGEVIYSDGPCVTHEIKYCPLSVSVEMESVCGLNSIATETFNCNFKPHLPIDYADDICLGDQWSVTFPAYIDATIQSSAGNNINIGGHSISFTATNPSWVIIYVEYVYCGRLYRERIVVAIDRCNNTPTSANPEDPPYEPDWELDRWAGKSDPAAENILSSAQLYPNPARNELFVEVDAESFQLKIIDINGQLVMDLQQQAGALPIDTSNLKNGQYFMIIQQGELMEVREFVKME